MQAGGQRFESVILHGKVKEIIDMMETQSEIKTQNCEREAISRARIEQLKYNGKVLQKGETKRKADKGAWGMPVALGGEEGRDKLRKAAVRGKCPPDPRMSEWGNPSGAIPTPRLKARGERGELKHLSTRRKRK